MVLRSGTERDGANGSGGNNNRNNEVPLPNPPVHPTLTDVLAQQTELMAHLVNQMGNAGNNGPRAEPQVNRFGEFFRTNPPIFCGSVFVKLLFVEHQQCTRLYNGTCA